MDVKIFYAVYDLAKKKSSRYEASEQKFQKNTTTLKWQLQHDMRIIPIKMNSSCQQLTKGVKICCN